MLLSVNKESTILHKRFIHSMHQKRTSYCANLIASFHVIIALQHDIGLNPGPKGPSPKCPECNKTIRSNQKHCVCEFCHAASHAKCVGFLLKSSTAAMSMLYTCNDCLHRVLPFQSHPSLNDTNFSLDYQEESFTDDHVVTAL